MSGTNAASSVVVVGSVLGTELQRLLMSDDLQPGSDISYQLCKTIYLYHPLGRKLVEAPISLAQSQAREITVPDSPEEVVVEQFLRTWVEAQADATIFNLVRLSRIYGIASLAIIDGGDIDSPLDLEKLRLQEVSFNVFDPLNTAGSLVENQEPNSPTFQKPGLVSVQGKPYHPSRTLVLLNEDPMYLSFTSSAFGFTGRSAYQRALFPLKSYVNIMVADDMIAKKLGLLIAKMKSPGSIIDGFMQRIAAIKRNLLKEAETGNVLSIDITETVETLNMMNVDGAGAFARTNILKDIATAADMPAVLVENETMVAGFGEGTEDAKAIARFVDTERGRLAMIYKFFDRVVMHMAWTPEFYATVQKRFPEEYKGVSFTAAFYQWSNSFKASWPSLLIEPDSEKAKGEDVKLKAIIALLEVLLPTLDPANKARAIQWAADNFNALSLLFTNPLELDAEALKEFLEKAQKQAEQAPQPGAQGGEDSGGAQEAPAAPKPFAQAA